MGRFYGTKIKNAEINPKTGEAWTLDDVPRLWKHATEVWLADRKLSIVPGWHADADGNVVRD